MNYKFNSGSINLEDVTGEVNGTGLIISTRAYARIIMYSGTNEYFRAPATLRWNFIYIYICYAMQFMRANGELRSRADSGVANR